MNRPLRYRLAFAVLTLICGGMFCARCADYCNGPCIAPWPSVNQEESKVDKPDANAASVNAPRRPPISNTPMVINPDPIYFDFDRWEVRADQRDKVQRNARLLRGRNVTLTGACDVWGTAEYNYALGERRALSVRQYLIDLGVPSSAIETATAGEDLCECKAEDALCCSDCRTVTWEIR